MANDSRVFYHIVELTESLEVVIEKLGLSKLDTAAPVPSQLMARQMRIQLAIAQQLSVISTSLQQIVKAIERSEKK